MNDRKEKYLFIYLRTGGGHLAPARSVANHINKYYPASVEVLLIDGFEKTKKFARSIVEDGYRLLQSKAKWFYTFLYATHKFRFISSISAFLVSINMQKYLRATILRERPDKIVLFHFFLIHPVYKIIKELELSIPILTVVTDPYTAHPLWFNRKDQNFIVFSERLKEACIKKGIDSKNLHVFPFILDDKFSGAASQQEIERYRQKHGFDEGRILLILGGGDGIPKGAAILKSLLKNGGNYNIAIVCGNNKRLLKQAHKLQTKSGAAKLKVYGFVNFVYELISLSDAVITKCGASTFMEILISKKIPVVNSYIWEQEKGNVEFIVANGLGIYEKRISRLPHIINRLFEEEAYFNKFRLNIERASLKNGTAEVAAYIISM